MHSVRSVLPGSGELSTGDLREEERGLVCLGVKPDISAATSGRRRKSPLSRKAREEERLSEFYFLLAVNRFVCGFTNG